MTSDYLPPTPTEVGLLMEMTHEAMRARWRQGLVTPMSPTINTFAKTDGSWWTASQDMWQRVSEAGRNEQLDCHHARFGSVRAASGPVTAVPWSLTDEKA